MKSPDIIVKNFFEYPVWVRCDNFAELPEWIKEKSENFDKVFIYKNPDTEKIETMDSLISIVLDEVSPSEILELLTERHGFSKLWELVQELERYKE